MSKRPSVASARGGGRARLNVKVVFSSFKKIEVFLV